MIDVHEMHAGNTRDVGLQGLNHLAISINEKNLFALFPIGEARLSGADKPVRYRISGCPPQCFTSSLGGLLRQSNGSQPTIGSLDQHSWVLMRTALDPDIHESIMVDVMNGKVS